MTDEAIGRGFAALKPGTEYAALGDAARCRCNLMRAELGRQTYARAAMADFSLTFGFPIQLPNAIRLPRMLFGDFFVIGGQRSHARLVMPRCRTLPRNVKLCWRPDHRSYHQLWGFIRITS